MITKENYSEEHIRELQNMNNRDPILIERALVALGLLEALVKVGFTTSVTRRTVGITSRIRNRV